MTRAESKAEFAFTRIELLSPHTHAGTLHAAGDVLDLDEATARWLIERGVARTVDKPPSDNTPTSQPGD